jgi:hypothetical protein
LVSCLAIVVGGDECAMNLAVRTSQKLIHERPRRRILRSPYPRSCIAPVLWGQKRPIAPVLRIVGNTTSCGVA